MANIIMIQGTASGAGKSVLAAALCRIFTRDGYKTAPFKTQNMSSVCHKLADGGKMARSQALAAYACMEEPESDMNPILLIPSSGTGAEVIVNGKTHGVMAPGEYSEFKLCAFEKALEAFNRLAASHDIIVAEGAGSPVELNLNQNDIANMGLAVRVNAPVILTADILRGGVFASLYGTVSLLPGEQRTLIKGMIVNKFKGDVKYFGNGRDILERICGVPVLGVIPYADIRLEDEDSLMDAGNIMKTKESLGIRREDYTGFLNEEFDRLAAHIRENLNMGQIYSILKDGVS